MKAIGYFASFIDGDYTRFGDTPEEAVDNCKGAAEDDGQDYEVDDIEVFAVHSKARVSSKITIDWGAE